MMTSTFPTSRTNSREIKYGLKDIQHKKETLMTLEAALKKRMNEFKELCLKEGELTGQLPIDYPLQPREPIPQVRRRITRSHGNIPNGLATSSSFAQPLAPPCPPQRMRHNEHLQNPQFPFPLSRPTSTNSSSSSTSTASSNTRSLNHQPAPTSNMITSNNNNNNNNSNVNNNGHHYHSNSLNMLRLVQTNKGTGINGKGSSVTNFQPYYEETKPFQMSDFYKYSSKHRQKINCDPTDRDSAQEELNNMVKNHTKSTRQLQDEILQTKNSLKFSSCDDQLQPTVNIFEKSGQKLMEATARAIAGNPALAEKLNNILPNHNHYQHHNHRHHHHKHLQHLHQKHQQQQQQQKQ